MKSQWWMSGGSALSIVLLGILGLTRGGLAQAQAAAGEAKVRAGSRWNRLCDSRCSLAVRPSW